MSKKNWEDVLEERVSMEHEARVTAAVASELEVNASRAGVRKWNWNFLGGLGLLGVATFGIYHMIHNAVGTLGEVRDQVAAQGETMEALSSLEVASDFDVVSDLDVLDNLDELENWNGVDV